MKNYISLSLFVLIFLFAQFINAATLSEDAIQRGINPTCSTYLDQIEKSYNLEGGINITFAHPEEPSIYPSLHISAKNYNNGSSTFSATLSPDQNYCYLSTSLVTAVNNQSCNDITLLKLEESPSLNSTTYSNGDYTILTPTDFSYQIILATAGDNACTMTETRMIWPGR